METNVGSLNHLNNIKILYKNLKILLWKHHPLKFSKPKTSLSGQEEKEIGILRLQE